VLLDADLLPVLSVRFAFQDSLRRRLLRVRARSTVPLSLAGGGLFMTWSLVGNIVLLPARLLVKRGRAIVARWLGSLSALPSHPERSLQRPTSLVSGLGWQVGASALTGERRPKKLRSFSPCGNKRRQQRPSGP
jgi:hypothetical protein